MVSPYNLTRLFILGSVQDENLHQQNSGARDEILAEL